MHEVHVKEVGLNEGGFIVFVADFPHEECLNVHGEKPNDEHSCLWCDHHVSLHPEALASRMYGYGLATQEEAFDAVVREHALRLHHVVGEEEPKLKQRDGLAPEDGSQVGMYGGLHSQVKVVHGDHRLSDVLGFHGAFIERAHAEREPRVFSTDTEQAPPGLSDEHRSLLLATG